MTVFSIYAECDKKRKDGTKMPGAMRTVRFNFTRLGSGFR